MSDPVLVAAAIARVTDGNQSAFGRLLGHRDGSRVRAWLSGRVRLPETERRLCVLFLARPQTVRWWRESGA